MAEVVSTCSANDTSGNTSNGGAWYTTITDWEAAAQTGSATNAAQTVECYNDFPALEPTEAGLSIGGWSATNAGNHPTIRAATGQGHNGVPGDGFILSLSTAMTVEQSFTLIQDIGISTNVAGMNSPVLTTQNATGVVYERLVCFFDANSHGFNVDSGSNPTYRNLLVRGSIDGIAINCNGTNVVAENCTVTDYVRSGFYVNATTSVTNCVASSSGANGDFENVSPGANNASSDNTAPITGVVETDGVDYVQPSALDYTPTPSPGKLDGTGLDLSLTFTDDITGATRTLPWEIGAYDIIGAPAGAVLTSGTVTGETQTTATIGCTTDTAGGTLYWYVSTSATPPSAADLKAGTGSVDFGNLVPTSGANTAGATGLTANTTYYHYWIQST